MSHPQIYIRSGVSKWWKVAYLLPLIIAIGVLVTHFSFYRKFLFKCSDTPCSPITAPEILSGIGPVDQTKVAAYVARASWTLINGVHLLACIAGIITAVIVINSALSDEYDKNTRRLIILMVLLLAADAAVGAALLTAIKDASSPAQQLLRATVGQYMGSINKYQRLGDAWSLTATLCLAAAACATVWQSNVNKRLKADEVAKRVRLLRPILYVGAAMLVIAVLRLSATHAWAVSYLPPDTDLGKAVTTLTRGIIGTLGVVFTLLIAGIYLPAAIILRARVREIAPSQPDPNEWMNSERINLSFPQTLGRAIILISPFLAGPLGERLVEATKALGGVAS